MFVDPFERAGLYHGHVEVIEKYMVHITWYQRSILVPHFQPEIVTFA